MQLSEFETQYLMQYLLLEEDFKKTIRYVTLSEENYKTYSNEYLKLILAIGSEVDIVKKLLANLYAPESKRMNTNKIIIENEPDFKSVQVDVRHSNITLLPWNYEKEPEWWTVYNEIKHNRMEIAVVLKDKNRKYYQYGNLENTINALAGLLSLEYFAYRKIAILNNNEQFVPVIKSIFSVSNLYWKDTINGTGMVVINSSAYISDMY